MPHLGMIKKLKQMWRKLYFVIKEPDKGHRYLNDKNLIYLQCPVAGQGFD
jgi:hypothetical protein